MKRGAAALLLLSALLCAAVLLHCGASEVVGRGGSEVVGKLVKVLNKTDSIGVQGAIVSAYKDTLDTTKTPVAVATTDKNGTFIVHIPKEAVVGVYFLYGRYTKDTLLVAYIPNVHIDTIAPDKTDPYTYRVGTHPLLPPGSVSGRVTVYSGENGLILVDIPALSYQAHTDDSGRFTISNIPPGKYVIRYSKDNFKPYVSDSITINSGRDTVLVPKVLELDPNKPIPEPLVLIATPNVKNGTVVLSWSSVPSTNLYGYILSRNKEGSSKTDSVLGTIAKPDTFFIDTVYRSISDTLTKAIHYSIESVDNNSKHSLIATSVSVTVIPPVKPGTVAIVSADSTDSSVTVRWNSFPESDFQEYRLHFRPAGKSVDSIIKKTIAADTACTIKTFINGSMSFSVQVVNAQGVSSALSSTWTVSIINTPPKFLVDTSGLDDSINIGDQSMFTLNADDANTDDSLSFSLKTPLAGLSIQGGNAQFAPLAINLIGKHRVVVLVNDQHGGIDSLVWNVGVVAHDAWVQGDSLINARRLFGAVTLNGQIFVIGGQVTNLATNVPIAIKTVEAYDTATGKWTAKASLTTARWGLMAAVWNNKIYAFGGVSEKNYGITTMEEYDPVTDKWSVIAAQMPFIRSDGAACLIGNSIYCIGGKAYNVADGFEVAVKSINIFNVNARTWTNGPLMKNSRTDHSICMNSGLVYIVGGTGAAGDSVDWLGDGNTLNTIEVFDPSGTGRCDSLMVLQGPRANFGGVCLANQIFCIGGLKSQSETSLSSVEIVNFKSKNSTLKASSIEQRYSHQSVELGGRIYCIGGVLGSGNSTRSVTIYYP